MKTGRGNKICDSMIFNKQILYAIESMNELSKVFIEHVRKYIDDDTNKALSIDVLQALANVYDELAKLEEYADISEIVNDILIKNDKEE